LLANKLFMGDFNEVLKPFPGDLQHVQWLHDTELGLHECRKATGPVPAKDVRRAGAFELLATLIMPNAVLTTPSLSATVCSKTRAKIVFGIFLCRVLGCQPCLDPPEAPPRAARTSQRRRRALKTAPPRPPSAPLWRSGRGADPPSDGSKEAPSRGGLLATSGPKHSLIFARFSAPTSQAPLTKAHPWRCSGSFLQCACMGGH
jgi:hypothetical protein